MASSTKKQKVDLENRQRKNEFTSDFCFILSEQSLRPFCLICHEDIAVMKSSNMKGHFETKHGSFNTKYPPKSKTRADKITAMITAIEKSKIVMKNAFTS